jgi:hypothetical protein
MRSVADELRRQTHVLTRVLEPARRIELALELGDADAALVAESRGLSLDEARRQLSRSRSIGRAASVANAPRLR